MLGFHLSLLADTLKNSSKFLLWKVELDKNGHQMYVLCHPTMGPARYHERYCFWYNSCKHWSYEPNVYYNGKSFTKVVRMARMCKLITGNNFDKQVESKSEWKRQPQCHPFRKDLKVLSNLNLNKLGFGGSDSISRVIIFGQSVLEIKL